MAYKRLNLATGDLLDQDVFKHLEDGIADLDLALDSKVVQVQKTHYGTNRFDKNSIPFVKGLYMSNNISASKVFAYQEQSTTYGAGGGWLNIPVEPGKTYTISVREPVVLKDFNNYTYGTFNSIILTTSNGTVVTSIGSTNGSGYYYSVNGDTSKVSEVNYSGTKVLSKAYGNGSNTARGLYTTAMTITIIDETISFMNVQIGISAFKTYQINSDFCTTRGYLTDEEISQLQNSFQINEGTELLEYEEYGDYDYIEDVVESNLTKLQSAFTTVKVESTNLLDPVNHVQNHIYITNGKLNNGIPPKGSYGRSALLYFPVGVGQYVLHSNALLEFGNKKFGYFKHLIFTDIDDKVITTNYTFNGGDISTTLDNTKAIVSGGGTPTLRFEILDENIKNVYIPILDSDKNAYGLWTEYENDGGLTDEELLELTSQFQLNKGNKVLKYVSFYDVSYKSAISPEYIMGLDEFQENMEAKIETMLGEIEISGINGNSMACSIEDNKIFVRARHFTKDNDIVWDLSRINQSGGNKYFNINAIHTCPKSIEDENMSSSLTQWKGCADDICPPNIMGTYIAANHGYNCVDKITSTAHGKTEKDIGSIWNDSAKKRYVLTHIYDDNTLGFVVFTDNSMSTGKMSYGSPSVGTVMTHESGATNINDVSIEARTSTQLWQCYNHYNIDLLVDGVKYDLNTNDIINGDRVEIFTQYDVIFVPAMLQYLMDNVGNNTSLSQNSDDINDSYMTMYINYQFNKNGSVSTYSSFYINKDITVGYIGLVQSQPIGSTAYTYIPDTSYKVLTLNDGSASQNFNKNCWDSEDKCPYRFFQFTSTEATKGMSLVYDRTIGWGKNDIRKEHLTYAGMYYTSKKMYPAFIAGGSLPKGIYFDGMAARVPLYKYDPDVTSIGWYWSGDDIHLMIDTHNSVNKDIILPDYMNNMRIEILDKTDSVTCNQTYIFNNKLRFISSEYGYLVLRLYK